MNYIWNGSNILNVIAARALAYFRLTESGSKLRTFLKQTWVESTRDLGLIILLGKVISTTLKEIKDLWLFQCVWSSKEMSFMSTDDQIFLEFKKVKSFLSFEITFALNIWSYKITKKKHYFAKIELVLSGSFIVTSIS